MGQVKHLSTGETVCNPRFRLITSDWDSRAVMDLATEEGFRITEQGKTDTNTNPGLYSIHSPLYGTDYQDENAFADRYSCKCGELQGRHYADGETVCQKCGEKVEFVDINMEKTGWIILDKDYTIQSEFYKKIAKFIGSRAFNEILHFMDPLERVEIKTDNPFFGIGMIQFRERFQEIMDYYYKKNKKLQMYLFIMSVTDQIFVKSIPVYNMHLRQFLVKGEEIKYSDEDKLYRRIYSNHILLNDKFELERRVNVRLSKKTSASYLRRENILYSIQKDLDSLWESSFDTIDKKTGLIKGQLLGGRMNFTARNVIVPDVDLRADEISLGYTTFLEVYKPELIGLMVKIYDMTYQAAADLWTDATMVFSQKVYDLMKYMMKHRDLIVTIDRNPSINYGSMMAVKIVDISPDISDYCMALPIAVLPKPNADFDGDIMNIEIHKLTNISDKVYRALNPRSNFQISRNDGLFDSDSVPFKDQIIGLYAFANYEDQ
jgi:DNA-directed RNA polymerase beta' subunit